MKLNFVACFLLREKFETTPRLCQNNREIRYDLIFTFPPKSWGNCYTTVQDYLII